MDHRYFSILPVEVPHGWNASLLPVSSFPIPAEELPPIKEFLRKFAAALAGPGRLSAEVFLQVMQLHWGGGPEILARHGRDWLPALGLGVWPDREPPRFWTKEDFENLAPDTKPRTLMYQVFRIVAPPPAREDAHNVMLGLGTLQIMTTDSSDVFLKKCRSVLLPAIRDPSYVCFPFYIPLLEKKSLASASAEQLDAWLCGASVYIRESKEDGGVLILSREPLGKVLQDLGARLEQQGQHAEWRVSY